MASDTPSELYYALQRYALAIANAWLPGVEGVYLGKIAANILHIADFVQEAGSEMYAEPNGRLRIDLLSEHLTETQKTALFGNTDSHSTKTKAISALAELPECTAFLIQNRASILENFPGGVSEFNRIIGTLNECRSATLRSPLSRELIFQSEQRWEQIESREGVALPAISPEEKEAIMKRPLLKTMFQEQEQAVRPTPRIP